MKSKMRIVDTRGQLCPAPLIATRKVLREISEGESFMVLTDNRTSFNNLARFLKDNNTEFTTSEDKGVWTLTVTRSSAGLSGVKVEEYCAPEIAHFEKGDNVIVIASDKMGDGDNELGQLLIINFIKALKDLENLPRKIVFYNKGVTLAAKSSPVIEDLRALEKMGVELLLCATCVNFYSLEEVIGAGVLSNMYVIAESMSMAGSIIRP